MRITRLLSIISFILFSIFFTVGLCTNNMILGALSTISLLGFFILLVIDLIEQEDEEWEEFMNKYYDVKKLPDEPIHCYTTLRRKRKYEDFEGEDNE